MGQRIFQQKWSRHRERSERFTSPPSWRSGLFARRDPPPCTAGPRRSPRQQFVVRRCRDTRACARWLRAPPAGDRDQSGRAVRLETAARGTIPMPRPLATACFRLSRPGMTTNTPVGRRGIIGGSHRCRLRQWQTSQRDEPFGMENRHRQLGPRRKGVALRQQDAEAGRQDGHRHGGTTAPAHVPWS